MVPIAICFVFGVLLMVLEVFMPGFGLPGISGIALSIASIVLTWTRFGGLAALGLTLIILAVMAIFISIALRSAANGKISKSSLILNDTESVEKGYSAADDMDIFLNREGTASTALRPAGIGEFDGVRLNVLTEGDYIPENTNIKIVQVDGSRILVKRV